MKPIFQIIEFVYGFLWRMSKQYAIEYLDGDLFEKNNRLDKFLDTFQKGR